MDAFTFNAPATILCEPGIARRLGPVVRDRIGVRVMIVTDAGLVDAGLLDPVLSGLADAGVTAHVFADVVADPPEAVVLEAVAQAQAKGIDGVIGLGGGSSMDVAKLVALLVGGGEEIGDIYGVGLATGQRLPLMQIPTTAGTGSEATPVAIVTVGEALKKGVVTPRTLPDVAVLDAELTLGLPAPVTAATGYDAMVHAIEAFTSTSANNNPLSRVLAREALRLLGANLETAVRDGGNLAARSDMLLGSLFAGMAFGNSPVAAVHALAYPIGGIFHQPHGISIGLVLPQILEFNWLACEAAYASLAADVFPDLAEAPSHTRAAEFARRMTDLRAAIGLPGRLREVGIPEDALPAMAEQAMLQTRLLVNNPREVTESDALAIYRAAY